ncbi:hypothetical protein A2U01_0104002, partial [Trifolium medium]|nr:hypothetical protein [Trifolium medium]
MDGMWFDPPQDPNSLSRLSTRHDM